MTWLLLLTWNELIGGSPLLPNKQSTLLNCEFESNCHLSNCPSKEEVKSDELSFGLYCISLINELWAEIRSNSVALFRKSQSVSSPKSLPLTMMKPLLELRLTHVIIDNVWPKHENKKHKNWVIQLKRQAFVWTTLTQRQRRFLLSNVNYFKITSFIATNDFILIQKIKTG